MNRKSSLTVCSFLLFFIITSTLQAQLSAPGAVGSDKTNYPVFSGIDDIFVFCGADETTQVGVLQVSTQLTGTKTYRWDVYNNQTASFELLSSESTASQTSTITGLENGCYRATVTLGGTTEIYRAWVFNNWIIAEGFVSDSNCETFKLNGTFTSSEMKYHDLTTNTEISVFKDMKIQWKNGETIEASVLNTQIFEPPTSNTDYILRVYDRFGCETNKTVTYESIVTKASFTANPMEGEAPLEVLFTNTSENGDANGFEWFFYRDLDEIKREAENTSGTIDSIMVVAYDNSPEFIYENTGTYMVKLVSKHYVNNTLTCTDTAYLEDYIIVDSSFIYVPKVFTPDGDGTNDEFVVKYWSMQNIKISIFNRWGNRVHYWSRNNIQGFENTYTESVWDGKISGRYASPGVYYYVVEGGGRDGKIRRAHGFVHLFRGKD
jgi:gliding motility-associated-like protein